MYTHTYFHTHTLTQTEKKLFIMHLHTRKHKYTLSTQLKSYTPRVHKRRHIYTCIHTVAPIEISIYARTAAPLTSTLPELKGQFAAVCYSNWIAPFCLLRMLSIRENDPSLLLIDESKHGGEVERKCRTRGGEADEWRRNGEEGENGRAWKRRRALQKDWWMVEVGRRISRWKRAQWKLTQ